MSWDVFVQDLPSNAQSVGDIPEDFCPSSIGERDKIIEAIRKVIPDVNFSDPAWGVLERDGYSLEINIGPDTQVQSFAFHVRGGGSDAATVIDAVLTELELRGLDSATGDIFSLETARRSFHEWQRYRDGVI